ncbi:ribonuclease P protein subunit p29 [Neocloeon triangulifer]|uniref:ribonuclease P protein subunit p29 n=1 Tax=Neocloeon triangulifer TaxID=2078957 RepID=UPI00286EC49E|nr:ribonuclease P protein subunit p29 [Neocloeon triangulifer]
MESVKDLYLTLDGQPLEKQINIKHSETKRFIESVLPFGDRGGIDEELRKRFPLEMHKKKIKQDKTRMKKGKLSYKEMKSLNLRKLPKTGLKYSDYLPLNKLWTDYIKSYVNLDEIRNGGGVSEQGTLMLQKADFHGAVIRVVRSKCSSLVGSQGIILMDTKNMFQIICKNNMVKSIPKQSSLFEITIQDLTISVFGKHFITKPAERSTKKVKARMLKDIV